MPPVSALSLGHDTSFRGQSLAPSQELALCGQVTGVHGAGLPLCNHLPRPGGTHTLHRANTGGGEEGRRGWSWRSSRCRLPPLIFLLSWGLRRLTSLTHPPPGASPSSQPGEGPHRSAAAPLRVHQPANNNNKLCCDRYRQAGGRADEGRRHSAGT